MNRIKKFYRNNEEMINSSLMVVAGIGCAIGGGISLREMHRADGLQINDVDVFRNYDGSEDIRINLRSGKTVGGHVTF